MHIYIPLPVLAVGFAAFSVWLAIRIINRRERWAKRTAVAVAVTLFLYPLSFGPACWLVSRTEFFNSELPEIYLPIGWLCWRSEFLEGAADKYGRLGMPSNGQVHYPVGDETFLSIYAP